MIRTCKVCTQEKELNNLNFNFYNKSKFKYICKICENTRCKEYHKNNKISILERKSNYYKINSEKEKLRNRKYSKTNAGRLKTNIRAKKFYKKNSSNIVFMMRRNCSKAIWKVLKNNNSSKFFKSILQYLPYSIEELKIHIEKQFDDSMRWANYGIYWEIDHIIPQSILPYNNMECDNFKKCWGLKNLRPYPATLNRSEGASKVRHNINNNVLL